MIETFSQTLKGALRIGFTNKVILSAAIKWLAGERAPTPRLLRQTFEQLGTTYIKLGQFIASSPSLFPEAYVREFQNCLDNTTPIPFYKIQQVIRKELNRPLHKVFAEISPTPLATASVAQVHAARLITGEDVVIKVQKPNVHMVLQTDLNFLYVAAKTLEWFVPKLSMASLSDIVEELQKSMLAECDFFQEAKNIEDFRLFLNETHNFEVTVPKVYPDASSLRVLTMERLYGVPFTDLNSVRQYSRDPQHSLITAMNTWFSSLLLGKSFHADVHAGNLLLLQDGRIGFIDFGIVGCVRAETWASVASLFRCLTENNYLGMAEALVGIGITEKTVDTAALAGDIAQLYQHMDHMQDKIREEANVNEKDINRILMDLVRLGKKYGIHFPREFALLLKQILYFDRYIQVLAPNINIYHDERFVLLPEIA